MNDKAVELGTNDSEKKLKFVRENKYDRNFIFGVQARSGQFAGAYNINVLDLELKKFVSDLAEMNKSLNGEATLADGDSESLISFRMLQHGKVLIKGLLGGSLDPQSVRFEFESDQTVISPLKMFFEKVLSGTE